MDSWNPNRPYSRSRPELPPEQITYRDMQGIMASDIPTYQSGMFVASLTIHPPEAEQRPFRERVRMCFADFFPMFEVPFLYGGGWGRGCRPWTGTGRGHRRRNQRTLVRRAATASARLCALKIASSPSPVCSRRGVLHHGSTTPYRGQPGAGSVSTCRSILSANSRSIPQATF